MRDRIASPWGARTPYDAGSSWPARVDTLLADGVEEGDVERWVQTASMLHSNGDAMDIAVRAGRIVGVRGRAIDRVNRGRLDVKDLYGWQANSAPDRLTEPLIRRDGVLVETSWEEAMEAVAARTRELLATEGPSSLGFYTTGQFFAEEYWTLATIVRAGLGSNHLDGNTRLCTATAGEALKESFGCDGQPASYSDVDHADVIALFGHNVAETQSVLWMRILDRLAGADPPQLICVDPRLTEVARHASVHLAPRVGTNVAILNALLHEVIANDWIDPEYIAEHTVGFEDLRVIVTHCTPEWAQGVCDVPAADIRRAARIIGTSRALLCTVLQGFYQSNQGTAAAVQVNNLVLVRAMLGRAGAGVLQMNGQPSAQNTRECGANGDLPGFRNWANPEHVAELAEIWNVDVASIPHYAAPTAAMDMFRYAEQGSLRFLWISGTNPAVSLPELARVRRILRACPMVVVQDLFLTETAQLADVVLPAATWGEKTGVFTNADRTVHLSDKAVDPPGHARADLDIFLDYARRMDFRDKAGAPLISWDDAAGAFDSWKRASRGRPCDYSELSYEKLRGASGVQWPCTADRPDGTERLYGDGVFFARPSTCETYGKDLITGASVTRDEYFAFNPSGRAMLKGASYVAPREVPSAAYPLQLTTGRTIYQFHTRTKTGRVRELNDAAPDVWVEISASDCGDAGIAEGDVVAVRTARGAVHARVRVSPVRSGVIFVPFHYGYWDDEQREPPRGVGRAANELTPTDWDPVSKQPLFKTAAAALVRLDAPGVAATRTTAVPAEKVRTAPDPVMTP